MDVEDEEIIEGLDLIRNIKVKEVVDYFDEKRKQHPKSLRILVHYGEVCS